MITVSIFTDHWGEIKKKPLTLIISKLRLARRSALSTFLREADEFLTRFSKNSELCTKRKRKIFWKKWALICHS